MLSPSSFSTITRLHLPSLFTSSVCTLFPRAAGPAFEPHVQPASVLYIRFPSTTPTAQSFTTSSARNRRKMPPKKKEEEKKVLLGRPGNSLKSGIVRTIQPHTSPSALPLNFFHPVGRLSKRRQIDPLSSHHQMFVG